MNADRLLDHYEKIADAPRRGSTPAALHSRLGRARQVGGAGSERRTGGGVTEADCSGEGAVGEGEGNQEGKTTSSHQA